MEYWRLGQALGLAGPRRDHLRPRHRARRRNAGLRWGRQTGPVLEPGQRRTNDADRGPHLAGALARLQAGRRADRQRWCGQGTQNLGHKNPRAKKSRDRPSRQRRRHCLAGKESRVDHRQRRRCPAPLQRNQQKPRQDMVQGRRPAALPRRNHRRQIALRRRGQRPRLRLGSHRQNHPHPRASQAVKGAAKQKHCQSHGSAGHSASPFNAGVVQW